MDALNDGRNDRIHTGKTEKYFDFMNAERQQDRHNHSRGANT